MNEVQQRIRLLVDKGWSLVAMANELGVTWRAVAYWRDGERYPENAKPVLMALDALLKRKRIPKQRRYAKGSRRRTGTE